VDTGWWQPQYYQPTPEDRAARFDPLSYRQLYSAVLFRRILGREFFEQQTPPRVWPHHGGKLMAPRR